MTVVGRVAIAIVGRVAIAIVGRVAMAVVSLVAIAVVSRPVTSDAAGGSERRASASDALLPTSSTLGERQPCGVGWIRATRRVPPAVFEVARYCTS
jgi:hypothetical protein